MLARSAMSPHEKWEMGNAHTARRHTLGCDVRPTDTRTVPAQGILHPPLEMPTALARASVRCTTAAPLVKSVEGQAYVCDLSNSYGTRR